MYVCDITMRCNKRNMSALVLIVLAIWLTAAGRDSEGTGKGADGGAAEGGAEPSGPRRRLDRLLDAWAPESARTAALGIGERVHEMMGRFTPPCDWSLFDLVFQRAPGLAATQCHGARSGPAPANAIDGPRG